ncbi:YSIRK-type signal peptide-containing protein [uncultured Limosilactobacillus sp.]|uniref:mucin-binding protein n=1 Tax=uncultured Limosilactobacillus sp. TaxID=2837629 RepID=UPI0025DDEEF7|nr:YSIRK-type signal peptide-containing protein [uncultured Limosilactobacillus sp.]
MVSKKNNHLKTQQNNSAKQHYGLRKLSVGVASVLLGTTVILGGSVAAHADVKPAGNTASVEQGHPADTTGTTSLQASAVEPQNNVDGGRSAVAPTNNVPASTSVPAAKQISFTVKFVDQDQNNQEIASKTFTGQQGDDKYNEVADFYTSTLQRGYKPTSDSLKFYNTAYKGFLNKPELHALDLALNQQTYQVACQHQYQLFYGDPNGNGWGYGKVNGIAFNAWRPLPATLPAGLDKDKLAHRFTRTVILHLSDGTTKTIIQQPETEGTHTKVPVLYQTAAYDMVTGQVIYSNHWAAVIDGHMVTPATLVFPKIDLSQYGIHLPGPFHIDDYFFNDLAHGGKTVLEKAELAHLLDSGKMTETGADTSNLTINVSSQNIKVRLEFKDALTGKALTATDVRYDQSYQGYRNVEFEADKAGQKFGDLIKNDPISNFIPQINGYQFVGDLSKIKNIQINANDESSQPQTIVLEYARLSPVIIRYIDEATGKPITQLHIPTDQVAISIDPTGEFKGDTYNTNPVAKLNLPGLAEQANYQPNIPGFKYTGRHSNNTAGMVTQTYQLKNGKLDSNPVYVDYYYQVTDPVVAKYSLSHPELGNTLNNHIGPNGGSIGDQNDYTTANQGVVDFIKKTGSAYVGGINTYDGEITYTPNDVYYFFLANKDVKVNYINELTGEVMKSGYADWIKDAGREVRAAVETDIPTQPRDTSKTSNLNGQWTTRQLSFDGMEFDRVDRSTSGIFGILGQEVNYYYLPIAKKVTDTKTAKRIIHFVADNGNYDQLQSPQTQTVYYTTSYYADANGKPVNVKTIQRNGKTIYVVDPDQSDQPQMVWQVDPISSQDVTVSGQQASFDRVQQDQIDVANGSLTGQWLIERATHDTPNGQAITSNDAPQEAISNDIADGTVENVYLIYDQKNSYKETLTFTRTVVYRGTKDGGTTYQPVNGSPAGTNKYRQTITFTRTIVKNARGQVISTGDWQAQTNTLAAVPSKQPGEVGYKTVDIEQVASQSIDPNNYDYRDQPIDLGTTTVTYTATPNAGTPAGNAENGHTGHSTGSQTGHQLPDQKSVINQTAEISNNQQLVNSPVAHRKAAQLPQTGSNQQQGIALLGLAGLLTALGLGRLIRKQRH